MGGPERRPIVTLAALYGAGGSLVGPLVAEALGVAYLDRVIPQTVAAITGVSEESVAEIEDQARTGLGRLTATLGRLSTVTGDAGGSLERLDLQEAALRGHIEEFLARSRVTGGVVLGRGGMVVLRALPWALHVHLRGPRQARVKQGAAIAGISTEAAAERQKDEDTARRHYVRRAYGIDPEDPSLYHLVLDSTALSLEVCTDIIVEAATARVRDPR
jgi:hypothetical protein